MEEEVPVRAAVAPGFVGLQSGSGVAGPAGRLPMPQVNDAPVIEVPMTGPGVLKGVVGALAGGQLEGFPDVEEPAVVFPQPLPIRSQLETVALAPEPAEEVSPV